MATWKEFEAEAPETEAVFRRRLEKTGMGLLATLRRDGFPRISPLEPALRDGELLLGMMGASTKSRDLQRDPRCCLHSATEDKNVADGDAKLWGRAVQITDPDALRRFAGHVKDETGYDVDSQPSGFDLFRLELTGASAIQLGADGQHLRITAWTPGDPERVIERR
jgi:Pyridoxamine 5'-phosphate oxidase